MTNLLSTVGIFAEKCPQGVSLSLSHLVSLEASVKSQLRRKYCREAVRIMDSQGS